VLNQSIFSTNFAIRVSDGHKTKILTEGLPIWKLLKTFRECWWREMEWPSRNDFQWGFSGRVSGLHIFSQEKVNETSPMCVYRGEGLIWINKKAKLQNIIIHKYFQVIVHKTKQIYSKPRNVY
jgi:hypothetical protein